MTYLKHKAPTLLSVIEAAAKSPYKLSQLKKNKNTLLYLLQLVWQLASY